MVKKQLLILLCLIFMGNVSFAQVTEGEISLMWDINFNDMYPQGELSNNFYPTLIKDKLVFGDKLGFVKTLDVNTKKIEDVIQIPMEVQKSIVFDPKINSNYVLFYGIYHRSGNPYYSAVDMESKRVSGIVRYQKEMMTFGQYSVFEQKSSFNIFSPKDGMSVFRQKTDYDLKNVVYTQDFNRYIFQTNSNKIVEMNVPPFGAIIITKRKKNPLLEFYELLTIEPDMIVDNINENIMYYHRENGAFGMYDIDSKQTLWEKKFFSRGMEIQGPEIINGKLFYLISKINVMTGLREGKLVCLNQKNGLAEWIVSDMEYSNFKISFFDPYIVVTDDSGNLLFLDVNSGNVVQKIHVGQNVFPPVIFEQFMYVVTPEKIFKFENSNFMLKIKLMIAHIISYFE